VCFARSRVPTAKNTGHSSIARMFKVLAMCVLVTALLGVAILTGGVVPMITAVCVELAVHFAIVVGGRAKHRDLPVRRT